MPATTYSPFSSRYQAVAGIGYDGVVRVRLDGSYATGVLLNDGRSVLTAAHLFDGVVDFASNTEIIFETPTQNKRSAFSRSVAVHPDYDREAAQADLAIVHLEESAFTDAQRYDIYREDAIAGQRFTMVGYGVAGNGSTGIETTSNQFTRRMADNTIDGDIDLLNDRLGSSLAWKAQSGTQFIADFDNGRHANDAAGRLFDIFHTGVGAQEGLISPGDSGGPAFIGDAVVGIATYTASLSNGDISPDIDESKNSSYGEIAAWQKLIYYQEWIDKQQRDNYENPPIKVQDVIKEIYEGDKDTVYAYFLLEFHGKRSEPSQILSVDYTTRNGTAKADEDYIALNGRLNLYPDETQAVIAVEIIGDEQVEANETFYLDVMNPVGGSFEDNVATLSAMRTIINDDFIA